jgi:SpoVK/Ycf46/Vps4 family AAA+-type ATPase
MQQSPGVYLFDEFDAIGGDRSLDNDVGEMRRILNSFLQFIERDDSESVIISVTNNPNLLDQALYRRFDDVLYYENPDNSLRKELIRNVTGTFASTNTNWDLLLNASDGLSHAEIDLACRDAIKIMILSDKNHVSDEVMVKCFANRKQSQRGNRKK